MLDAANYSVVHIFVMLVVTIKIIMSIDHKQTPCKFTFLDSDILFLYLRLLNTKSKDKQPQRNEKKNHLGLLFSQHGLVLGAWVVRSMTETSNARIAYFSFISFPVTFFFLSMLITELTRTSLKVPKALPNMASHWYASSSSSSY